MVIMQELNIFGFIVISTAFTCSLRDEETG
jgi:hypothetical protein